jgi:hypothetical protein
MVANHSTRGPHSDVRPMGRPTAPPPGMLHPESREAAELLESLDDAMFMAIAGEATIVAAARLLWDEASRSLPNEVLDESREQYLRYALEVTQHLPGDEPRDQSKVLIAIEMMELLSKGC